jgi:hypothetical protein
MLRSCGWKEDTTEWDYFEIPLMSTKYIDWWALKPREIVKRFRASFEGSCRKLSTQ